MTSLGTLPGDHLSGAIAINERGQITGFSNSHVFLWQSGSMSNLGLPPRARGGEAYAMNERGQVVGYCVLENFAAHPCLWQKGKPVRDLGTLGGYGGRALAINERGQIVGRTSFGESRLARSPGRTGR